MKFRLKLPSMNRNWLTLGGAALLGLAAFGLSSKWLSDKAAEYEAQAKGKSQMTQVVVARVALPRGVVLQKEMLQTRLIPVQFVHASSIDTDHIGQYLGQKLAQPIQGGEALLDSFVEPPNAAFSATLTNGNRALTTEVDEVNSISGMLRPGDHIDLMATARGTGNAKSDVTFALLSNVAVLATGQATHYTENASSGEQQQRVYTTITLSVSPQDAQRLVVAKTSGRLTAVLRNPEDTSPAPIPTMTIDDVLPKTSTAARRPAVQYIIGGQS